jgi:hypothetical protein
MDPADTLNHSSSEVAMKLIPDKQYGIQTYYSKSGYSIV